MHGTIKWKKTAFVLLSYDLVHPCSPCWQVKANMYQLYESERMKGGAIVTVLAVVARGAGPKKDDSKKDLASSITIFPLGCHVFCVPQRWLCTVHLYWRRGDRQMRQKAKVLTLIGVLTSSAGG